MSLLSLETKNDNIMTKILPPNFQDTRYGLSFRFVNEGDAEFIYKLRSDSQLSKYIHDIQGGVQQQVVWIKAYKQREAAGEEYYFIYFKDGEPVGLNRLYSFHDTTFTGGSWVMVPNSPMEVVLATSIINREVAFEDLGMELEDDYDATHIENKKVIKFNKMFGAKIYKHFMDVKGEYVAMSLTKEDFEMNKPRLVKMLNLENK